MSHYILPLQKQICHTISLSLTRTVVPTNRTHRQVAAAAWVHNFRCPRPYSRIPLAFGAALCVVCVCMMIYQILFISTAHALSHVALSWGRRGRKNGEREVGRRGRREEGGGRGEAILSTRKAMFARKKVHDDTNTTSRRRTKSKGKKCWSLTRGEPSKNINCRLSKLSTSISVCHSLFLCLVLVKLKICHHHILLQTNRTQPIRPHDTLYI